MSRDLYLRAPVAINVGSAEVKLEVDGKGFLPALKKLFSQAETVGDKEMKAFGEKAGKSMSKGFSSGAGGKGGIFAALIPALPVVTSLVSNLAGGLTALTGSLARAATASASVVGIYGTMIQVMLVAKVGMSGLTKAIGGDATAMASLSANAQTFAKGIQAVQPRWKALKDTIQQHLFQGLAAEIKPVSDNLLPVLNKNLGGTAHQMNILAHSVGTWLASKKAASLFGNVLSGNNKIFANLRHAAVPLLRGLLNLYVALQPAAQRLARYIAIGAKNFAEWATQGRKSGTIAAYMDKAWKSAKTLFHILGDLFVAVKNILNASANSGDSLWKSIRKVTKAFADWTGTVKGKNAIAQWAKTGVDSLRVIGHILGTLGPLLAALFNPDIGNGFLHAISGLTPAIKTIFGVLADALRPIIDALSGPEMAKFGADLAKLFVALSPVLKGLGLILGDIITQALSGLSLVIEIITPVVAILANVIGPVLQKLAPIIAFLILNFGLFGATFATKVGPVLNKMGPVARFLAAILQKVGYAISGKVIPALEKMSGPVGVVIKAIIKLVQVYQKIFGLFVKGASKFANALKPIGEAISAFFGNIVDAAKRLWHFLFGGSVFPDIERGIKAFVKAVQGYFRVWILAFRLVVSALAAGFRALRSGFSNLLGGIRTTVGAIRSVVVSGFGKMVSFIEGIPGKIMGLVGRFLSAGKSLGSSIIHGIFSGLQSAVSNVGNLVNSIKDAINGALGLPHTIHGPGPLPDITLPAFARGTNFAPGGLALVGEQGPELVHLPRGSRVDNAANTRDQMDRLPKTLILRVGNREFTAYLEQVADRRIDAAESLLG